MKIKIKRYHLSGKCLLFETSGGAVLGYLDRERLPGPVKKEQYYLSRGYFRNNKLKVIGVDLIE